MDSIEDEDSNESSFLDVETVSFADWHKAHYERNQSKQLVNEEEEHVKEADEPIDLTDATEATSSIKCGPKKRTKTTTSGTKVTKRPKMSDDNVDEGTTTKPKSMLTLELKCAQSDCYKMFDSVKQLRQHQKSAHGVLRYACLVAECSEQFSNSHQIASHYSTAHPGHTNWTCSHCNAKMNNCVQLGKHIGEYHKFGRYHCQYLVCTFEADLRSKVRNHLLYAHPSFSCTIDGCSKIFGRKSKLQQHLQSHKHINTKSRNSKMPLIQILELNCPQGNCAEMFDTVNKLKQHQKTVHNVPPYQCLISECSQHFYTNRSIGRHYSTVHPHHTNWTCSVCEAVIVNRQNLHKHIRESHQLGRFRCAHVGCNFEADVRSKVRHHRADVHGFKVDLTDASITHAHSENRSEMTIQNPIQSTSDESTNSKIVIVELSCVQSECDMKFSTWEQLHQHRESAHGVLRYPCLASGCSQQFNSGKKIGPHIQMCHPNHTKWTCGQCNVVCVSSTKLRIHLRIHENFVRYRCGQAGCIFEANNLIKMYNHSKVHVRTICAVDGCARVFNSKISLERHQQSVHFD